MGKLSIVVPVWNVAPYLSGALDCILAQKLTDWECILVDDGSTDESPAICDEYAAKDSRFTVVHQHNAGAGAARNAGLDRATGEYLLFVDPDDLIHPTWADRLIGKAECDAADVVLAPFLEFDLVTRKMSVGKESRRRPSEVYPGRPFAGREFAGVRFIRDFGVMIWDKLYRRSFVMNNGIRFQDVRKYNDMCFAMECGFRAERISTVDFPGYLYFTSRSGSLQNSGISEKCLDEVAAECRRRADGLDGGIWMQAVEEYFVQRSASVSAPKKHRFPAWNRFRKGVREAINQRKLRRLWPEAFEIAAKR